MPDSLEKRRIDVTFTLQPSTDAASGAVVARPIFTESGTNQVTVSGLRVSAMVQNAGSFSQASAHVRIYGLRQSLMNQLSTLGKLPLALRNTSIAVSAGDAGGAMSLVYIGTIVDAWANMEAAPQVCFEATAMVNGYFALKPVPPASYPGGASVAVILGNIATQMGLAFENNGVTAVLANQYLPGTLLDQLQRCVQAAGIEYVVENNVLAIWPRGGSRGGTIPLISPATGMVGYPGYTRGGVVVRTLYSPSIRYGSLVKVQSDLPAANGTWRVFNLSHALESETPNGQWFSTVQGVQPSQAPIRLAS